MDLDPSQPPREVKATPPLEAFDEADPTGTTVQKDHAEEAKEAIASAQDAVASSNPQEALRILQKCETASRIDGDIWSCLKLTKEMMSIYLDVIKDDNETLAFVETMCRKRAQHAMVETALVREAYRIVTEPPSGRPQSLEMLRRLRAVSEGKLHVEAEHSRLTVAEANLMHAAGEKEEAFDLLVGMNVETLTALPRLEKMDIILLTMERGLEIKQYPEVRTVSNKIVEGSIMKADCVPQRKRYHTLLLQHHVHYKDWFSAAMSTKVLYETCGMEDDATLSQLVGYLLATPAEVRDPEQKLFSAYSKDIEKSNALARGRELVSLFSEEKRLRDLDGGAVYAMVGQMLGSGLISLKDAMQGGGGVGAGGAKGDAAMGGGAAGAGGAVPGSPSGRVGMSFVLDDPLLREELKSRILEHNVFAIAEHVSVAPMSRVAALVGCEENELEELLGSLVATGDVWCCIDRVDGTVRFHDATSTALEEAQWRDDVHDVFAMLDQACHLISRERLRAAAAS